MMSGAGSDALGEMRGALSGSADLDRSLAAMGAAASGMGGGRDAPHVILYGDTAGPKVGIRFAGPGSQG